MFVFVRYRCFVLGLVDRLIAHSLVTQCLFIISSSEYVHLSLFFKNYFLLFLLFLILFIYLISFYFISFILFYFILFSFFNRD